MDTKDLKGLMEAYSEVYAPQEEIEEAVKGESSERRKDLAAERRAGVKPLPAKEGEKYASRKLSQMAYAKRKRMGEEVEEVDEAVKGADPEMRRAASAERRAGDKRLAPSKGKGYAAHAMQQAAYVDKKTKGKYMPGMAHEELDIFDVVLEFLQAEGYAETLEEAEWMMANVIDEEAIDIILDEALTGERYKTALKKGKMYSRKVSADPKKRATRGGRGGESDFGAGDRGAGNKAARRAGTYREYDVNEAQHARENPEKYEREQTKKSAPVRGERTPMPPRGDKRREDFEKWYRANVR